MLVYIMAIALIIASILLGKTGWVDARVYYLVAVGVVIALINELYMAYWIVAGIIVVVMVGFYWFIKNMVVG